MSRVLITGGSGFVGQAVTRAFANDGWTVRSTSRSKLSRLPLSDERVAIGNIGRDTDWGAAIEDVDCIVHLAARVHVLQDSALDPLAEFRSVNVEGTHRLASIAAQCGVKRFVFMSSIGVNGNRTEDRPFSEMDEPHPRDAYSRSKWEAELVLSDVARQTGMEVVIIRPPLVYGPGAPGNFARLIKWIASGWPLPLGSVDNRRSFIYVNNLTDVVVNCAKHPGATGQVFLVSDGEDLSITELITRLASKLGMSARLYHFPSAILKLVGSMTGFRAEIDRLTQSLIVDIGKVRQLLGWRPPLSVDEGLAQTADWFIGEYRKR